MNYKAAGHNNICRDTIDRRRWTRKIDGTTIVERRLMENPTGRETTEASTTDGKHNR